MSEVHALVSPSGWSRGSLCPGSYLLTKDMPDVSSSYADEGTVAHAIAASLLRNEPVEGDIDENILAYVDYVRAEAVGGVLVVEQRMPIESITGEKDAYGTVDTAIFKDDTIIIVDLKFGMGHRVEAKGNEQLLIYLAAALRQFEALGDFKHFKIAIMQPRLNHVSEWEVTREYLDEFLDEVKFKTDFIWRLLRGEVEFKPEQDLVPSEETCRFCKARATCPALANKVMSLVSDDFVDLDKSPTAVIEKAIAKIDTLDNRKLSHVMQNVGLLEDFIKAVRAKVELELFAGHEVPGFKIVEGKRGNRKWEDEKEVEKAMKELELTDDQIYTKEVISVSKAEKLLKKEPKKWTRLCDFVTQTEGKPSVTSSTDPRPAIQIGTGEDAFEVIENG